jgi:hypothetical protein
MSLRLLLGNYWDYTNRMAGNLKLRWSQRIKKDDMVGAKLHQIVNPLPPDEIISFFWLQSILRWSLIISRKCHIYLRFGAVSWRVKSAHANGDKRLKFKSQANMSKGWAAYMVIWLLPVWQNHKFTQWYHNIYSKPWISRRRLTRQSSKSTLLKRSQIAVMIFPIKLPSISRHS